MSRELLAPSGGNGVKGVSMRYVGKSIYLAGTWTAKADISARAKELLDLGLEVTSTWLDFNMPYGLTEPDVAPEEAERDTEDLLRSDTVLFNLDLGPSSSGATYFEHGLAVASGKTIWVIGDERPNIFWYLPNDGQWPSWLSFLAELKASEEFETESWDLSSFKWPRRPRKRPRLAL